MFINNQWKLSHKISRCFVQKLSQSLSMKLQSSRSWIFSIPEFCERKMMRDLVLKSFGFSRGVFWRIELLIFYRLVSSRRNPLLMGNHKRDLKKIIIIIRQFCGTIFMRKRFRARICIFSRCLIDSHFLRFAKEAMRSEEIMIWGYYRFKWIIKVSVSGWRPQRLHSLTFAHQE